MAQIDEHNKDGFNFQCGHCKLYYVSVHHYENHISVCNLFGFKSNNRWVCYNTYHECVKYYKSLKMFQKHVRESIRTEGWLKMNKCYICGIANRIYYKNTNYCVKLKKSCDNPKCINKVCSFCFDNYETPAIDIWDEWVKFLCAKGCKERWNDK